MKGILLLSEIFKDSKNMSCAKFSSSAFAAAITNSLVSATVTHGSSLTHLIPIPLT